jgi:hypothetical protein
MNPNEITNADIAKLTPEQRLALAESPAAAPEVSPTGMAATNAPAVDRFRMIYILGALKLEAETGIKMTSRRKVEFGVILSTEESKRMRLREEKEKDEKKEQNPGA